LFLCILRALYAFFNKIFLLIKKRNIFHTTCTIGGKMCKLIIDGGSCENILSTKAVQKLQLKQEKHPKPCKLSWFKKEIR